ncbi:TetR/AcrR family transcriptional regulator [Pseudoduganella sp. RAF53_2]|uniref:TetR/AcrR family transcriptional regulator n=1 Tax=unclassified Pseudoduganella TaxID=2637179 RepID=UPI003F9B079E
MTATDKRRSDPERAATRRRQVLEAAAACFRRSGFHGASMSDISKTAGMSAGHIYNYFNSKDEIIIAFVEEDMERVSTMIRDLASRPDPLLALLEEVPLRVRENLDPNHWLLPLEIYAEASRNPRIATVAQEADARARKEFRAILHKGRALHGLLVDDRDIDGRMEAIISLFQGLQLRALQNPDLDADSLLPPFQAACRTLLFS